MKEIKGICLKCLGCNKLEIENFVGTNKCKNFGGTNEQVLQQKNNSEWNTV